MRRRRTYYERDEPYWLVLFNKNTGRVLKLYKSKVPTSTNWGDVLKCVAQKFHELMQLVQEVKDNDDLDIIFNIHAPSKRILRMELSDFSLGLECG